jgi:glycosyltransferase involved in cell wall biosynthesis
MLNSLAKNNLCIVLPCPPDYSETFLKVHVEKLLPRVSYLGRFPIDTASEFSAQAVHDDGEKLKQRCKASVHRYVLNPAKKIYLRNFFRSNQIKLVLAEYGVTGSGVLGTCQELGIPLIVHFHGYDAYLREVLDRYEARYKKMFAYSSAVVAVSTHMIDQLVNIGAPREKVFYNPYGVDLTKFRQASLVGSPLQVLAVGRFVEKKAPYLTILAFKKVLERLPEARLVMVGGGVLHDVCRAIIKSLHMEHAVDLKGALDHDDVANLMQGSRLFVQHSLVPRSGDTEGTPVAIMEAGASGLPVVSTAHAGIKDVVIHGRTGFLVDEGDIEGMSEYMYRILTHPELAVEMGKLARQHIADRFNVEDSIANLRAILSKYSPNLPMV